MKKHYEKAHTITPMELFLLSVSNRLLRYSKINVVHDNLFMKATTKTQADWIYQSTKEVMELSFRVLL